MGTFWEAFGDGGGGGGWREEGLPRDPESQISFFLKTLVLKPDCQKNAFQSYSGLPQPAASRLRVESIELKIRAVSVFSVSIFLFQVDQS